MMYAVFSVLVLLISSFSGKIASLAEQVDKSNHRCSPCSCAFLAGPYIYSQKKQLFDHTETSVSSDLCEGLPPSNIDVPGLSELHRHLDGEGSHRHLVSSLKFDILSVAMLQFLDSYYSEVVIIERLPNGVFADPFELQHLVEHKVFLDVAVFGDTNLELPAALSNRSVVEIHVDVRNGNAFENQGFVIELPLHARYPPLDASGYAKVEIGSPEVFLRYRPREKHSSSCIWVLKDVLISPAETVEWHIPCGDEAHAGIVTIFTFLSALVCSLSIVVGALLFNPNVETKKQL